MTQLFEWSRSRGFVSILTLLMLTSASLANPAAITFVGDGQQAKGATDPGNQTASNNLRNWNNPLLGVQDPNPLGAADTLQVIQLDATNIASTYRPALNALLNPPTPAAIIAKVTALLGKVNPGSPNASALGDLNPQELIALLKYSTVFKDNQLILAPKNNIQIIDTNALSKLTQAQKDAAIPYETITVKHITYTLTPVYTTVYTYFPS